MPAPKSPEFGARGVELGRPREKPTAPRPQTSSIPPGSHNWTLFPSGSWRSANRPLG
jgi:hypothetical protein